MPQLAALLFALFSNVFAFVGQYLTKRVANYVAIGGTLALAWGVLYAAVSAAAAAVSAAAPSEVSIACSWFWPSNGNGCLAAVGTIEVALFGFRWQALILLRSSGIT